MDELIQKYIEGGSLTAAEIKLLRSSVSRSKLEALATGDTGKNGRARRFFKLCNLLFSTKHGRKTKPAAPQPATMFGNLRTLKSNANPQVVSGGGVNSTGKRR
jgi:hypothetical protein